MIWLIFKYGEFFFFKSPRAVWNTFLQPCLQTLKKKRVGGGEREQDWNVRKGTNANAKQKCRTWKPCHRYPLQRPLTHPPHNNQLCSRFSFECFTWLLFNIQHCLKEFQTGGGEKEKKCFAAEMLTIAACISIANTPFLNSIQFYIFINSEYFKNIRVLESVFRRNTETEAFTLISSDNYRWNE